jgi:hypothetical protein
MRKIFYGCLLIILPSIAACSSQQQAQAQVDAAALCQLGALAATADPALAKHNPTAVAAAATGCAAAPQVGTILAPVLTKSAATTP